MLWQGTVSMVVLLCQPWQHISAVTVVRCSLTALASWSERSKSPRMQPALGQSTRKTDLARLRLGEYLIWLFLVTPLELKEPRCTIRDFNWGNLSVRLG